MFEDGPIGPEESLSKVIERRFIEKAGPHHPADDVTGRGPGPAEVGE
jgi:hypothetical protein